jgi:uncharacterized RDD family membrane protein YckC
VLRPAPSIYRRLAALPYEALLVLALSLVAAFPLVGFRNLDVDGVPHLLMQLYYFCLTAWYFTWFWRKGGQTLAMKTWRIRVTTRTGLPLGLGRAMTRYLLALAFYGPACMGTVLIFFPERLPPTQTAWLFVPSIASILWAWFDSDRQFLHDHLSGTRLTSLD